MARRSRLECDAQTRAKIQTTQLIKRLQKHVLGEVELTNTQIKAAEVLIRKTLPDLSAIHQTNNDGNQTIDEWLDDLSEEEEEGAEPQE